MEEIWKDIEGYEGKYQISNLGRVKSLKRNIILKQSCKKNYMMVSLYKNEKKKCYLVHRLVGKAFIPNKDNLPQINHKDENSMNNCVDNLEWCTAKYNCNYGTHIEKIRERMRNNNVWLGRKHTEVSKQKMSIAKLGKESKRKLPVIIKGIEYDSITNAMKQLNIGTKKIYKLIKEEIK